MVLEITSTLRARLLKAAQATPDVEVCGLLFGTAERIDAVTICANVAGDPRRTFELDPAALFAALRAERQGGPRLIGYFHSHPNGSSAPSAIDAARAAADGKIWLIIGGDEIAAWLARPSVDASEPTHFSSVTLREMHLCEN